MTKNGWGSNVPVEETKGGTNQSTYTTGDILYSDGANSLAKLAIGTATEVLTVTGGVPTWEPSGGASGMGTWVYLHSQTALNDATIEWDNTYITSTYSHYAVVFRMINIGVEGNFSMRVSNDNGSTFETTNYKQSAGRLYSGSTLDRNTNTDYFAITVYIDGGANAANMCGVLHIMNPASASLYTKITGAVTADSTLSESFANGGQYEVAETINAIQFYQSDGVSSGDILDGEFILYGIKES